jgi:hydrogenase small subunit
MTTTDCPIRKWNERINWPVQANTNCIGCAQYGFPDGMEPFVRYYTLETDMDGELVEVLEDE